ncbi:MAG TPA: hypothetical protein VFV32_11215 [Acidimicrobiales bacterium]|nr:hypothetical protein [Acidimicrobiales bacterium]
MPCAADPAPALAPRAARRWVALTLALLIALILPLAAPRGAEVAGAEEPTTVSASDDAARLERTSPVQRHRLATALRRARAMPVLSAVLRSPGVRSHEAPPPPTGPVARPVTRRGPPVA